MPPDGRGEESVHPNERERFAMHVKSSASPSPATHAGASAPSSAANAAKGAKNGPPDFSRMLNDAKAGAPASAATAPTAAPAAASAAAVLAPSKLSLDTASLAARA